MNDLKSGVKDAFVVKIIPPKGYSVYRLRFTRRHVFAVAAVLIAAMLAAVGVHTWQLKVAENDVRALQTLTADQQKKLQTIDKQADALTSQLRAVQRENAEIKRLIGADHGGKSPHAALPSRSARTVADFEALQARLHRLSQASDATTLDAKRLQQLAMRVLNLRRVASIARERMLAQIPSLNPVNGGVAAGFGWRTNPWPEFHKGVDLMADYGTVVHSSAAGVVANAGWDGGFGIKVDIDHGNGYHTWYAHLSRVTVAVGQHVTKGAAIALSGSTGESTGPHLHYQVMYQGQAIDPAPYLNGVPAKVLATLPSAPGV